MSSNLVKAEAKAIFQNKKLLIPIIAILFIPILYTGMFLWAFWDPYDRLEDLPVAIVNGDEGADFDGTELQLGDELVKNLQESKDFAFKFVDKEKGYKELKNEQYYMLVEIPADFSQRATTLLDDQPQKLQLIYVPNEGYNFLSAQIGGTAVEKIKSALSEKITETYAETMFDKMGDLAEGLNDASEGANAIREGTEKVNDGSVALHDNLSTLAEKSIQFSNGVDDAKTGSNDLASGAKSLEEGLGQLLAGHQKLTGAAKDLQAGTTDLSGGISQTKDGLHVVNSNVAPLINGTAEIESGGNTLSSGLQNWQQQMNQYGAGVADLQKNLQGLLAQMPEDSMEKVQLEEALNQLTAGSQQLAAGAGQLADGGTRLAGKIGELNAGQRALQSGLTKLEEGASSLESGAAKISQGQSDFQAGIGEFGKQFESAAAGASELRAGAGALSNGMSTLQQGSAAMQEGASKLTDGAGKLTEGNQELLNGSGELANKLGEGAEKAGSVSATDQTFEMMAGPVEIENNRINKVPNYGTGFAPYFLSLGLFVGALLLSIVFPLREPVTAPRSAFSWFSSKFAIIAGVGILQALIAVFLLIGLLKIEVQSLPLFILFAIITSLTFIALIQFFVTAFGDPGRFIAIVILILQLTTSAGTFPLELIPTPLQAFNAFLPMTYTVAGFKAVVSSGDFHFMWQNAGVLFGFIVLFLVCSFTYFKLAFKKKYSVGMEE
ncbi:YhgE/Pip family protein [Cytobacillus purgationiresistens]|uniref:Membrane protein n=1 Tax=Cytobacillus purgationiresistens TaxID=863449 RepID=A0ABU0AC56_9BACI|nr:YhgE/Pip domain-containing protein [Cytobacillus purgationiresistens]MDQ0268839.1 putative membrane protein [Cytobacillus purgationiresistens]